MKLFYCLSIIGMQLLTSCTGNNEKKDDTEQTSKAQNEQETKTNSGAIAIDPSKISAKALFTNSKYEIWQELNHRNSLLPQQNIEKNHLDGVIYLFVEKFYGPGEATVPIILYVAGDFVSVKIGDVQQELSQGENFISVPWTFQRGYNRIPVTGTTSNASFNCAIEITFD